MSLFGYTGKTAPPLVSKMRTIPLILTVSFGLYIPRSLKTFQITRLGGEYGSCAEVTSMQLSPSFSATRTWELKFRLNFTSVTSAKPLLSVVTTVLSNASRMEAWISREKCIRGKNKFPSQISKSDFQFRFPNQISKQISKTDFRFSNKLPL